MLNHGRVKRKKNDTSREKKNTDMNRIKITDIEAIEPGKSKSFQLESGLACNAAKTMVAYARNTRGYNLSYSCDWKNLIVTITKNKEEEK